MKGEGLKNGSWLKVTMNSITPTPMNKTTISVTPKLPRLFP